MKTMYMVRIFVVPLLAFCLTVCSSQSYAQTTNKTSLTYYLNRCQQRTALHLDTFFAVAKAAKQLSVNASIAAQAEADYFMDYALYETEKNDTAFELINKHITLYQQKEIGWHTIARFRHLKLLSRIKVHQYEEVINEAQQLMLEALEKKADDIYLEAGMARIRARTSLNSYLVKMGNQNSIVSWYDELIQRISNPKILTEKPRLFLGKSIAFLSEENGRNDSALIYVNKALALAQQQQDLTVLANANSIKGTLYTDIKHKKDSAVYFLFKALEISRSIGNHAKITACISSISSYYQTENDFAKALKYLKEEKEYSMAHGVPVHPDLTSGFGVVYKGLNDYKNYANTLEEVLFYKDSLYSNNYDKKIAQLETSYNLKSKQLLIAEQQKNIQLKNLLLICALAGIVLTIILSITILLNRKKKQQMALDNLRLQNEKLAEQEKLKMSQDLHDNVGAYANAVLYQTQIMGEEEVRNEQLILQLQMASRAMITSLRETVWALKNHTISAQDCWGRISNFIQNIRSLYSNIEFEINAKIPANHTFDQKNALHLVRIVQEAVSNAARHSSPQRVAITSHYNGAWYIAIIDNGKGFDTVTKTATGDGLKNMEKRAQEAGFGYELISEINEGTTVKLTVSLAVSGN